LGQTNEQGKKDRFGIVTNDDSIARGAAAVASNKRALLGKRSKRVSQLNQSVIIIIIDPSLVCVMYGGILLFVFINH